MNKISLTIFTIIIGVLLVVTFLQMEKPNFKIENKFIVIPQSSVISNNLNNVVNNIVNIADEQKDSELIKNSRGKMEVEKIAETSMFKISVFGQDNEKVKELNEQVIFQTTKKVAENYQLDSDFKINLLKKSDVIENELTNYFPMFFWALVGVLISILVVMFVEIFISSKNDRKIVLDFGNKEKDFNPIEKINSLIQNNSENAVYDLKSSLEEKKKNNLESNFVFQKNVKKEENVNFLQEENQQEKFKFVEENRNFVNRSVNKNLNLSNLKIPSNLPIVNSIETQENNDAKKKEINEQGKMSFSELNNLNFGNKSEPTEEELKARLNSLLSGKI